jgi:hypothetical protein
MKGLMKPSREPGLGGQSGLSCWGGKIEPGAQLLTSSFFEVYVMPYFILFARAAEYDHSLRLRMDSIFSLVSTLLTIQKHIKPSWDEFTQNPVSPACTVPLDLAFLQARKILSASCAGTSHSPSNSADHLASSSTAAHTYGMRKIDSAYLRT